MFEENLVENRMMEKEDNDDVDQNEVYSSDDNDSQSEVDDESEEDDEANIHQGYSKSSSAPSNVGCDSHGDKINTNQNQDGDKDDDLMSEDPVYMVVLKHALKQRRQSLHKKRRQSLKRQSLKKSSVKKNNQQQVFEDLLIEEEIESTESRNIMIEGEESNTAASPTNSTAISSQQQIAANSPKLGKQHNKNNSNNHSRSSSDISIASEEVREINRKTFISACQERQNHQTGGGSEASKHGVVKPAIPVIPSPDYTVPDEGTKHPHHVYRPFWSDNEEETAAPTVIKVCLTFDNQKLRKTG